MAAGKRTGRKRRAKIELAVLSTFMVLALIAISALWIAEHAADRGSTEVSIAVIGSSDDQIWKVVQQELDRRRDHIHIVLKPFQDAIYVNQSLSNREVDLNAAQHYAFLHQDSSDNGYRLSVIGDTYISPMNLYSKKYRSPEDFKNGEKVAIPNNPTNMGRALKVLAKAGLIRLKDPKATTPLPEDVVSNPKNLNIEQVDPAGIINLLPDYAGGVVNANFVVDAGLKVNNAIYQVPYDLTDPANKPYINAIVARRADNDNPTYRKVVDAYHTKVVGETIKRVYKGASIPAFSY